MRIAGFCSARPARHRERSGGAGGGKGKATSFGPGFFTEKVFTVLAPVRFSPKAY